MKDIEQLLTDKDLASVLKLSRSSVWRLSKEGKLPKPIKIGTSAVRWKRSDIQAFLDAS